MHTAKVGGEQIKSLGTHNAHNFTRIKSFFLFTIHLELPFKTLYEVYVLGARIKHSFPESKIHVTNMGPTWVLSAPGGPHADPMNFAIRVMFYDTC